LLLIRKCPLNEASRGGYYPRGHFYRVIPRTLSSSFNTWGCEKLKHKDFALTILNPLPKRSRSARSTWWWSGRSRARFCLEETNLESFHISPEKAFTLQPAGNEPRVEADVSPDPARKKPNATLTATAFRQEPECDPFYEGSVQTPVDDPARRWQLFERDRHSFGKVTR
jgi:hypothetical protein